MHTYLDKSIFITELIKRTARDQALRQAANKGKLWDETIDHENTTWIKEVIETSGWPMLSDYGEKVLKQVWTLVQHADHDPGFQEHCLELMKLLPPNEVNLTDMAYLEDRVRVNTGRKQLYGTQFYVGKDNLSPQPIENEANLEARRKAAGLNTFTEYTEQMKHIYKLRHGVEPKETKA